MKKLIIGLVFIVLLVFVVGMFVSDGTEEYQALVEDNNAILLVDQKPSEETVVSYAKLSQPGYILVFNTNTSTGEKEVLGSSEFLEAGEHKNVKVTHKGRSRSSSGSRITATVVADDGDGVFDEQVDTESLTDESEALVDEEAVDPEDLTEEDLIDLLNDEGYEINEDAVENMFDFEDFDGSMEDGTDQSDDSMSDDGEMTEDDSMEEGTEDGSGDMTEDDQMTEEEPVQE